MAGGDDPHTSSFGLFLVDAYRGSIIWRVESSLTGRADDRLQRLAMKTVACRMFAVEKLHSELCEFDVPSLSVRLYVKKLPEETQCICAYLPLEGARASAEHTDRLLSRLCRALTGVDGTGPSCQKERVCIGRLRQLATELSTDLAISARGFAATLYAEEASIGPPRTTGAKMKKCLPLRKSRVTVLRPTVTKTRILWSFGELPGDSEASYGQSQGTNMIVFETLGEYRLTLQQLVYRDYEGRLVTAFPVEYPEGYSRLPSAKFLVEVLRCIFACSRAVS